MVLCILYHNLCADERILAAAHYANNGSSNLTLHGTTLSSPGLNLNPTLGPSLPTAVALGTIGLSIMLETHPEFCPASPRYEGYTGLSTVVSSDVMRQWTPTLWIDALRRADEVDLHAVVLSADHVFHGVVNSGGGIEARCSTFRALGILRTVELKILVARVMEIAASAAPVRIQLQRMLRP
jgi:hypothetical protein